MRIFTIGYEQTTQDALIAALQAAQVARVIDVRAVPLSRKPGFSKRSLAAALADTGIGYVHLRALGTPPDGRAAARRGDHAELARVYDAQLAEPAAIAETAIMLALAADAPSALLCFERDAGACHRSLLLAHAAPDAEVVDLVA